MLLLLKSGLSGFISQLSIAEENLVMYYLSKLSVYKSMGPDRKHSEYIEEVGWCYYKAAFYHLLKGCVHQECSLIIGKANAATIVRKMKIICGSTGQSASPQSLGSKSLSTPFPSTQRGKKWSGSVVIDLPRANRFSTDQITFLFEQGECKELLFYHHITKVFNTIFLSSLVAQLERYDLDR